MMFRSQYNFDSIIYSERVKAFLFENNLLMLSATYTEHIVVYIEMCVRREISFVIFDWHLTDIRL